MIIWGRRHGCLRKWRPSFSPYVYRYFFLPLYPTEIFLSFFLPYECGFELTFEGDGRLGTQAWMPAKWSIFAMDGKAAGFFSSPYGCKTRMFCMGRRLDRRSSVWVGHLFLSFFYTLEHRFFLISFHTPPPTKHGCFVMA